VAALLPLLRLHSDRSPWGTVQETKAVA
jgi:hypothetical protein